jgi:hypothetical protein
MPQQFQQILILVFPFLFVGAVCWVFAGMVLMLWRRRAHGPHFPDRNEVNILFEERWTSGCSHKSLFTRCGGANNCLRVTVTDDELWVAPHFPFSAFAARFDLDHRVRRDAITKIEQNGRTVRVSFALDDCEERMLSLRLRNADRFCTMLQSDVASTEANAI